MSEDNKIKVDPRMFDDAVERIADRLFPSMNAALLAAPVVATPPARSTTYHLRDDQVVYVHGPYGDGSPTHLRVVFDKASSNGQFDLLFQSPRGIAQMIDALEALGATYYMRVD